MIFRHLILSFFLLVPAGTLLAQVTDTIRVETSPDGSGSVVSAPALSAGSSLTVYAVRRDAAGNFLGNVTATAWTLQGSTGGIVSGDLVPAPDGRSATFTGHLVGSTTIQADSEAVPSLPSGTITVIPGSPTALALVSGNNQTGAVDSTLQPFVVRAADAYGNPVPGATVSYLITSAPAGSGATLTPPADTGGDGQTSSTLTLGTKTGTYEVTATLGSTSVVFTTTATAGPKDIVLVETQADGSGIVVPAQNLTAGTSLTGYAIARDNHGNFVENIDAAWSLINSQGDVVPGDLVPAGDSKSAVFTGHRIGSAQMRATSAGLKNTASGIIAVVAGTASVLDFGQQPTTTAAGTPISPPVTVRIEDTYGNLVTAGSYDVSLALEANPGSSTLSGGGPVASANGIASFSNVTLNRTGTGYTLRVSGGGLTSTVSTAFDVTAGGAATMVIASGNGQTGTVTAQLTDQLAVTVYDAGNNPVPGIAVTFSADSIPDGATGTTLNPISATTDAQGRASTTLRLGTTAGTYRVRASAGGVPSVYFRERAEPGPAANLVFGQQPTNTTAGSAITPSVTVLVEDTYGNLVSAGSYSITLSLASNPTGATLSGAGPVTSVGGTATFSNVSVNRTGTGYTLRASGGGLAEATSNPFNILTGSAASIVYVSGDNQSATVGAQLTNPVIVQVRDAAGNGVSGVAVTFAVDSIPSGATGYSPVSSNVTTNSAGQASIQVTLGNRPGTYRISAGASGLAGSPVLFHATAATGPAAALAFGQQPTNTTAGGVLTPAVTVEVHDGFGNLVTGSSRSITLTLENNPSSGTLSGTTTVAASAGIASFNDLSINRAGLGYTLRASSTGLPHITSSPFNITAGTASAIAITSGNNQSGAVGAQLSGPLVVTVSDAAGNPVPGVTVGFAVDSLPSGASGYGLSQASVPTDGSGRASTELTLGSRTGVYRVSATATGLTGGTVFFRETAVAGPAAALRFVQQPGNTAAGSIIAPPVTVRIADSFGNPVVTGSHNVTLALLANPGSGTLSGTTTVGSSSGIATFSDLAINRVGNGYTLRATSSGLTPDTSGAFNISAGAAATIAMSSGDGQSAAVGTALAQPFVVTVTDAAGNPVQGAPVTFALQSLPPGATGATLSIVNVTTDGLGQASSQLTLGNRPGTYTVSASSSGLAGSPVQFSATATVGAPTTMEALSGDGQSGQVGTMLSAPFVVHVVDAQGNSVPGVGVTFAVGTTPPGTVGTALSATSVFTDSLGTARSTLTLGTLTGNYTVTASSPGLAESPLTFTALATPGPATQVRVETAPGGAGTLIGARSIASGSALEVYAVARDVYNNFVRDTSANAFTGWTLESITGSVLPTDLMPSLDRRSALFTGHLLGSAVIRASVTGLTSVPTGVITVATGGARAVVSVETAPNGLGTPVPAQSLVSGDTLRVYAVFRDAAGNYLMNDAADGWSLKNVTGGLAAGDLVPSSDRRSALFTAHRVGSGVIAAVSGTLDTTNSGRITVTPGIAASVIARTGTVQSTRVGTAFDSSLSVVVRDLSGNPLAGVSVRFAAPSSGASGTFAPGLRSTNVTTDANGIAVAPVFTANTIVGSYTDTARVASVPVPAYFALTNSAGVADTLVAVDGTPQTAQVGNTFAVNFAVSARDQYGNPVPGLLVRFTPPASGASGTFEGGRDTARADLNGIATAASFVADSIAGSYTVSAAVPGLSLSPALFQLTNAAGPVGKVTVADGDPQTTQVNTNFPVRFRVRVLDAADNPVRDALVTFRAPVTPATAPSGTFGTAATDTVRTDGGGYATAAPFRANTHAGSYTLNATVEGAAAPAAFRLTNTAAALDTFLVEAAGGGALGARVATEPFAIRVTALDAYGNTVTSFTGTVDVSANINLLRGSGRTPAFSGGILDNDTLTFARAGNATITVQRSGGSETGRSATFAVSNPAPHIVSVSPTNARAGESVDVIIRGSGFISGVTTVTFGDRISTTTTVDSTTRLTVTIRIDATAPAGSRNVTVINGPPGGGTDIEVNGFTIGDNPVPTLASLQPAVGMQGQTLSVILRGTNFLGGVSTVDFGSGITVNSATVDSSTRMTANITIDGAALTTARDVRVSNGPPGGGASNALAFTVNANPFATPAPVIPLDSAVNQPTTITLQWRRANAAQFYWLQVARDSSWSAASLTVNDSLITDTLRQVGPLTASTTYYWRVRALYNGGRSNWSPARRFATESSSYPSTITVAATVPFPVYESAGEYQASDYRIIGLPGASDTAVTSLLPGTPGSDWQVYWDNGDTVNYLKEYSAADTAFRFTAGKAFWLIKKGDWNVATVVPSAAHDQNGVASIPLHPGWNLITNPHREAIDWSVVQNTNGGLPQPIWGYKGAFTRPVRFSSDSCAGYYFLNDGNLTALKVPRIAGPSKVIASDTSGWRMLITLEWDNHADRTTEIGVSPSASKGLDRLDIRKPHGPGAIPGIFFSHPEWDPVFSSFASDIRPSVESLERWDLSITAPPRKPLRLGFEGVERVPPSFDILLIDTERGQAVDLRKLGSDRYRFTSVVGATKIRLVVGTHDAVAREGDGILPKEFALEQNFPNPFNPSTTIPVAVPRASRVSLIVYSLLGQEVATLHDGVLEPGRYWFTWAGNNNHGSVVATGVYVVRMTTDTGVQFVRKMLLMK